MGGVAAAGGALPAMAAASCVTTTPASTLLSGGKICEIVITNSGTYDFPDSISKLSAVLVGGGGAGGGLYVGDGEWWGAYGGGGGAVVYIDDVELGVDHEVIVGAGGLYNGDQDLGLDLGQPTSLGAVSAAGAEWETSGTGNFDAWGGYSSAAGEPDYTIAGGGARTAANWDSSAGLLTVGAGYFLSQIPGVDPELFPSSADGTTEYGRGGIWNLATVPNSGQGAPGILEIEDGAAGVVLLRYAAAEDEAAAAPALAETGAEVPAAAFAGFAGVTALGLGLMAFARRARRTAAS